MFREYKNRKNRNNHRSCSTSSCKNGSFSVKNAVIDTVNAMLHPIKTTKATLSAVAHPIKIMSAIGNQLYIKSDSELIHETLKYRCLFVGGAIGADKIAKIAVEN